MRWCSGTDTDWQDLFFDLLFAGGAFCGAGFLGESLINGQEMEGFFYFLLLFLCLANQWVMRIHYCSRYASTSMFHALVLEQLEFLLIATATWHIPLSETNSIARYCVFPCFGTPASLTRFFSVCKVATRPRACLPAPTTPAATPS